MTNMSLGIKMVVSIALSVIGIIIVFLFNTMLNQPSISFVSEITLQFVIITFCLVMLNGE